MKKILSLYINWLVAGFAVIASFHYCDFIELGAITSDNKKRHWLWCEFFHIHFWTWLKLLEFDLWLAKTTCEWKKEKGESGRADHIYFKSFACFIIQASDDVVWHFLRHEHIISVLEFALIYDSFRSPRSLQQQHNPKINKKSSR